MFCKRDICSDAFVKQSVYVFFFIIPFLGMTVTLELQSRFGLSLDQYKRGKCWHFTEEDMIRDGKCFCHKYTPENGSEWGYTKLREPTRMFVALVGWMWILWRTVLVTGLLFKGNSTRILNKWFFKTLMSLFCTSGCFHNNNTSLWMP